MKKLFAEIVRVFTWNPLLSLIFVLFKKLSSNITGDKNYKSNKNEFLALFIIFLIITVSFIYFASYPYYKSGWSSLEKYYKHLEPVIYQNSDYKLNLVTTGHENDRHEFYVKIMVNDSGFFFSNPSYYYGDNIHGNSILHSPLFIPWNAIKLCKKIKNDHKLTKIRMSLENTNVMIQLSFWDFLKPLCVQKGIPLIEY